MAFVSFFFFFCSCARWKLTTRGKLHKCHEIISINSPHGINQENRTPWCTGALFAVCRMPKTRSQSHSCILLFLQFPAKFAVSSFHSLFFFRRFFFPSIYFLVLNERHAIGMRGTISPETNEHEDVWRVKEGGVAYESGRTTKMQPVRFMLRAITHTHTECSTLFLIPCCPYIDNVDAAYIRDHTIQQPHTFKWKETEIYQQHLQRKYFPV